TAGRVPFFGDAAFKKGYGRSTKDLWRDFRHARERAPAPVSQTEDAAARLTPHGFTVDAPRRAEDGTIYYAVADPDGFPALIRLARGGAPARVAWRRAGGRSSARGR